MRAIRVMVVMQEPQKFTKMARNDAHFAYFQQCLPRKYTHKLGYPSGGTFLLIDKKFLPSISEAF